MVASAVVALMLALASPTAPPSDAGNRLDKRIGDSYAAAQALQGPLDGAWSLCDLAGRRLYDFEIVDPPGPQSRIEAAWRAPKGEESGVVDIAAPSRRSLRMNFVSAAGPARADLRSGRGGDWTGRLTQGGGRVGVVLKRDRC